jgi:hypothetical protein
MAAFSKTNETLFLDITALLPRNDLAVPKHMKLLARSLHVGLFSQTDLLFYGGTLNLLPPVPRLEVVQVESSPPAGLLKTKVGPVPRLGFVLFGAVNHHTHVLIDVNHFAVGIVEGG